MNCSVCNITCIKSNENSKSSDMNINIANFRNGSIICNACVTVLDMMGTETKIITKKEEPKIIKTISSIYCPKCKDRFSEQICKCGFKNPLFRK